MFRVAVSLAASATLSLPLFAAGSEPVSLESLPEPVRATALESIPGITLTSAEEYRAGDIRFFNLIGQKDGQMWDMEILSDGRMLEIERAMDVADLPEQVRTAALGHLPGGTLTHAEPYEDDDKMFYELEVKRDGLVFDMEIDEDGTLHDLQQSVHLDKLPQAVRNAVERALPGIVIVEAERGVEEDIGIFAVEGIAFDRTYEVTLNERGELLELEIEHDLNSEDL